MHWYVSFKTWIGSIYIHLFNCFNGLVKGANQFVAAETNYPELILSILAKKKTQN